MATHSSSLAWEILWTEEPGGLQPMGSPTVGHGLVTWLKNIWKWLQLLEFQHLLHHCHQYLYELLWAVGGGNGTPLQYSCLENPMDGGAWWAAVHGVAKSRTRLSDLTFTFHFHALEKEMATHSSVPAWRIPGTGEPGGLLSMGSHRVGHDWSDSAAAAAAVVRKSVVGSASSSFFKNKFWRSFLSPACSRLRSGNPEK